MQNQALLHDFIAEAEAQVNTVESGLLHLEKGGRDSLVINEIFRALHSIKGTAGFFDLTNIVNLSHTMENLFGEIRKGNTNVDNRLIDVMLDANDCLKQMIGDVHNSEQFNISAYIEDIDSLALPAGEKADEVPRKETDPELDNHEEFFLSAAQRGLKIYTVLIASEQDRKSTSDDPPAEVVENITSIGNIIDVSQPVELTAQGEQAAWRFLLTSVLEKSLLAVALFLPEENITEITDYSLLPPLKLPAEETGSDRPDLRDGNNIEPSRLETSHFLEQSAAQAPSGVAHSGTQEIHKPPERDRANYRPAVEVEAVRQEESVPRGSEESVRVNVTLLNDLLNLASEMVLSRNRLLRLLDASRKTIPGLNTVLQNTDTITTELQEKIMLTRMQPIARVFDKFPRVVRELAKKTGKNVSLTIKGQDVELDKSIVEGLNDPLTHLVRNAIDHGLEEPSLREKIGKPEAGSLSLHAYHEGGHVVIDVTDDGAGIDAQKIKERALEQQLFNAEEIEDMSEQELYNILCRAGFSLAEQVTDLSGRGVGLDVVRTNVEKMGGLLEVMSAGNKGTIFRLTMPLTLAIIPSLIVAASDQKFALPRVNLQEMVRLKPGNPQRRIEMLGESYVLRLRDKLVPVTHLEDALSGAQGNNARLARHMDERKELLRVLIIKSGIKRFGLVIDKIHDEEEILVKHLPAYLSDILCYSGVTILGDGNIAMILDPEGVAMRAGLKFMADGIDPLLPAREPSFNMKEEQSLLLFQCSGPEIFCLDLAMVSRVEKIKRAQLETVGDKMFFQFRGESLRVIRPEDYLPVTRAETTKEHLYIIIPKHVKHPLGLCIEEIIDTHDANIRFDRESLQARGIMGTTILAGNVTLVPNLFDLFAMADPDHYGEQQQSLAKAGGEKVLLVEDTPFFIKLEKQYLEDAGYKVLTAFDGKEAWKLLQEETVDIVVSDIEMPLMNGIELVKKIRADEKLSSLPVIAVTSKADAESIEVGLEAGFDYYEIKLNREMLLEKVRTALDESKLTEETAASS